MSRARLAAVAGGVLAASALALATVPAAEAGAAPQPAHHARTSLVLTAGRTSVTLDPNTAAALKKAGITVRPASEARARKSGAIAFPITGGVLNAKTAAGFINHSGGLTFGNGHKRLTIRDFRINTTTRGLSAYADQAGVRLRVFNLHLGKAKITLSGHRLRVTGVRALLNGKAAAALDAYFATTLFKGGIRIGVADVNARVRVVKG